MGEAVTEQKAGFTPGPWAVHPQKAYVVPADHAARPIGGAEDAEYDLAHYAQEICALHWPDPHRTEEEVKANARLIAAAPELAASLKEMVETFWDDGSPDDDQPSTIKAALAALAKAGVA